MVWFVLGITAFINTLIVFMACLGLWTYEDAKVRSQQPPGLWVLIVLLVPNLVGLIIYLLVGRTVKQLPSPGKYKRAVIISAVCFGLGAIMMLFGTISLVQADRFDRYGSRQIGSFVRLEDDLRNGVWTISADSANGYSRRNPVLNAVEMDAFHVTNISSAGNAALLVEQGNNSKTVAIPGGFDGYIDLSGFEPGRVQITVELDHAQDVNITIRWR